MTLCLCRVLRPSCAAYSHLMVTVLIAERRPARLAALEAALVREGVDVLTASTTLGVLRLARLSRVRVVLLDLGLPPLGETPVFDEVLASGVDLRVIALAERHDGDDAVSYLDHGAVDYLAKPVSVIETVARVRAQLRCVALASKAA